MTPDTAHKVSALVAQAAEALGAAAIAERLAIPRSQVEAVLAHAGGREARR